MSRKPRTNQRNLKVWGDALEAYAEDNVFEIVRHTEYQWNISSPTGGILLSVYPGSGLIYVAECHYAHTGLIDITGKRYYFFSKKQMIEKLNAIFFAIDRI